MTDLLFWRHAQAHQLSAEAIQRAKPDQLIALDLQRTLTQRGQQQARRMGSWLDAHTPQELRVLCSPAKRCLETAESLKRKYHVCPELAPEQDMVVILNLIGKHKAGSPLLVIGHQPWLGQVMAHLLSVSLHTFSVRKGAMWWLRQRTRAGSSETVVHCVQSPDMVW